jgi:hypothetical protein
MLRSMQYELDSDVMEVADTACSVCGSYGWVCEAHELLACPCGGVEKPCRCNPEAWLPDGFEATTPADLPAPSVARALGFDHKL